MPSELYRGLSEACDLVMTLGQFHEGQKSLMISILRIPGHDILLFDISNYSTMICVILISIIRFSNNRKYFYLIQQVGAANLKCLILINVCLCRNVNRYDWTHSPYHCVGGSNNYSHHLLRIVWFSHEMSCRHVIVP